MCFFFAEVGTGIGMTLGVEAFVITRGVLSAGFFSDAGETGLATDCFKVTSASSGFTFARIASVSTGLGAGTFLSGLFMLIGRSLGAAATIVGVPSSGAKVAFFTDLLGATKDVRPLQLVPSRATDSAAPGNNERIRISVFR